MVSECGSGGGPAPGSHPIVRAWLRIRRRWKRGGGCAKRKPGPMKNAQRERANVEDAATCMVAAGRVSEVDAWETERLAQVREQVRAEANRRRADHRTEAGAAIARMQDRGETLATIAELAGVGVGEIRAMLRYAPRTENHTAGAISGALGGGVGSAEHAAASATAAASDVGPSAPDGALLGNGHAATA